MKACVTLFLLFHFGFVELLSRPHFLGCDGGLQCVEQLLVATQIASFHQIGDNGQVLFGSTCTFRDGSDAMPEFQVQIPQAGYPFTDVCLEGIVVFFWQEYRDVDIGCRMQFTATITAHRNQCARVEFLARFVPELTQDMIDDSGT